MSVTIEEVAKHNSKQDCWVIIHGKAYDLTKFLPEHPGGSAIILKYSGKDATKAFDAIHPPDIIETLLPPSVMMGKVEGAAKFGVSAATQPRIAHIPSKVPLNAILNLDDFERAAKENMTAEAWAYYSSAADDEATLIENRAAFKRVWLKPRILVNVRLVDPSVTILGYKSSLPIYVTATALARLGHPDGETVLTRGAGREGVIQMIPTLSSCSLSEITEARVSPKQVQFFQLYVNRNREITERLVRKAENQSCKALFITVDAPALGKREKDMRLKFVDNAPKVQDENSVDRNQGAARAISSFIDPSLCWDDIAWFKSITNLPIILKGVQCAEDAVLAYKYGLRGIVLSNHGGRQLDYARSGIEVLPEVIRALDSVGADRSAFQVFVDGGVRRGTDILKAVALGANSVGIGRPFLYAMSTHGVEGVQRAIQILRDEFEMAMRLIGVTTVADLRPHHVDSRFLDSHFGIPDAKL